MPFVASGFVLMYTAIRRKEVVRIRTMVTKMRTVGERA
jgi:hypothetical protein